MLRFRSFHKDLQLAVLENEKCASPVLVCSTVSKLQYGCNDRRRCRVACRLISTGIDTALDGSRRAREGSEVVFRGAGSQRTCWLEGIWGKGGLWRVK